MEGHSNTLQIVLLIASSLHFHECSSVKVSDTYASPDGQSEFAAFLNGSQ